jgi:hypothetical protein
MLRLPMAGRVRARAHAFSVSQSQSAAVEQYIDRQQEHHRNLSFQEELRTCQTAQDPVR